MDSRPTPTERIRDYLHGLIPRGDALAIIGKGHPAYIEVHRLPCAGNHKVGYCAGVVVDKAAVLRLLGDRLEDVNAYAALPSEPPSDPERLDVERLGRAMWEALSYQGVLRIHADGWKELNDVAEAILARLNDTAPEPDPLQRRPKP